MRECETLTFRPSFRRHGMIYSISVRDVRRFRVRLLYLMLRYVHVVLGYIARTFIDEHRRSQARSRGIARDQRTSYRGNIGLRWDAREAPGFLFVQSLVRIKCISIILVNMVVSDIPNTISPINFYAFFFKNC